MQKYHEKSDYGREAQKALNLSFCLDLLLSVPFLDMFVRNASLEEDLSVHIFLAMMRSYTQLRDRQTCFESFLIYSVVASVSLSICLSFYVTCSIHTETQSGRIVARLGLLQGI